MKWPWISRRRIRHLETQANMDGILLRQCEKELANLLNGGYGHIYHEGEPAAILHRPGYEQLREMHAFLAGYLGIFPLLEAGPLPPPADGMMS